MNDTAERNILPSSQGSLHHSHLPRHCRYHHPSTISHDEKLRQKPARKNKRLFS